LTRGRVGLTWPWSDKGWYGQESRLSPEIKKLLDEAGRGKVNPIGYYRETPASAVSLATHNPYFPLVYSVGFAFIGAFLFDKLRAEPWGAWLVGGLFCLAAIAMVILNLRRLPAWHRARRLVNEYVTAQGEPFPRQLRWYS
jgi:hypothetical protein